MNTQAQVKQTPNPDVYTYSINVSRPNRGSIAAAAWAKNIKTGEWAPAERKENASSVDATFWMDRDTIYLLSELIGKEKVRSFVVNGKRFVQESAAKIALEQAIKETKERKTQEISMQPQPSQQQQRQASKVLPAQGEIMRQAWAMAKQLAGGSKGSRKFLSQAMKIVYAMYKK